MAMAPVTPDNCVAFPYLCFPGPWACGICPGLYLDTPQWIPGDKELEIIAAAIPPTPMRISFSDVSVDVRVDDDGELYGGLVIKKIRTDDWLLCEVHARITFYHPYVSPLEDDWTPPSTNRRCQKSFRIQPSRVPYLRKQLIDLSAQMAVLVERARRQDLWHLAVLRNPEFDWDSKRVRTVVFEIGMLSGGLAPLLWTLKAMVEAVAKQGKTPPWAIHMRAWGCHAIGRAPSVQPGMGFWSNNCQTLRRGPNINPWPASAAEVAASRPGMGDIVHHP